VRYTALPIPAPGHAMALAKTLDRNNAPLADEQALNAHIERVLAAKPLGGWELDVLHALVRRWFSPTLVGAQRIPEQPCLFVGNHGLFAVDGLIILPLMLREHTRFLRPLGDKFLFTQPQFASFLIRRGAGMGHPAVCSALMERGHDLLVFPGGAHEAVKRSTQRYELQWKERDGFVRLAASHGYTIVPFGMVGPDEFYDHLIEGQDIPDLALWQWLQRAGMLGENPRRDMIPPLARGALGTLLPKPQPCYLGFGEPLELADLRGKRVGRARLRGLRDEVAARINTEIARMLRLREQERNQHGLWRRLLSV